MNGYDTVFANAKDEELEFDIMFDQEDDLIDTIVGCNENGDPLTGAEPCPAKTADDRSCDDCNPDYEKDIDAPDNNAPKDAEGTVGYEFETKPEYNGKPDDQTVPTAEPVEGEDDYQNGKVDSSKGVENTVTGTIDNDKDIEEGFDFIFDESDDLGYEETDTEEERITDAPLQTPEDIEDVAKKVSEGFDFYLEDDLNGQDSNPEVNAKDRSCDDCNPDYEKDIDAPDNNAPKDAEGTVGYEFETKPEYNGKPDDSTTVDPKDVKIDEEFDFYLEKDEEDIDGDFEIDDDVASMDESFDFYFEEKNEVDSEDEPTESETEKCHEEFDYDITVPNNAEGTVGYDFEVNPEIGSKDDETNVDPKDVKIDEDGEVGFDFEEEQPEGSTSTVPEEDPTVAVSDCNEEVEFDFEEAGGIDKDVEAIEDPESYLDDDAITDAEMKGSNSNLEYDPSDEEVIDYVMNN